MTPQHQTKPQPLPSNPPASIALWLLAAGILAIFWHCGREINLKTQIPAFIALALIAGAMYLGAVYLVENFQLPRWVLLVIVVAAVLYRIVLLPAKPSLSEDVYRYQWEGRVEALSINPYTVYPAMPQLQRLQNSAHPLHTGKHTATPYPPLSEIVFSWAHTITGYKRLFTALDLATIAVLLWILALSGQPLQRVLIYAWNPTVIVSFALGGHHDSLAIFTLMLANLLIIAGKPLVSNALLALSVVSKFFAMLFLPIFLRRHKWRAAGVFAGVVILAYLPFVRAGWKLFGGLFNYASGWEGNDSLFRLIHHASTSKAQAEFVAGVLLLGVVLYVVRSHMPVLQAGLVLTAGLLLLSPNAFPWYFTWSVPFLCFYPSAPWLLMTVTCVLGYAPVVAYAAGQPYRDSPLILTLEYAPVIAWLVWSVGRRAYSVDRIRHSADRMP